MVDVITDTEAEPVFYVTVGKNKWFSGQVKVIDLSWYGSYRELRRQCYLYICLSELFMAHL